MLTKHLFLSKRRIPKRTHNERTTSDIETQLDAMGETKKFKGTQYTTATDNSHTMRTPKLAALIGAGHNLPPISPSNLKRKPSKNSLVNTSNSPTISQCFQPKKFYSPQLNRAQQQKTTEFSRLHAIVTSFNPTHSLRQETPDDAVTPVVRKKKIITELTTSRRNSCQAVTNNI